MAFRDGPFENLKVPLAWTAAVVAVVGVVGAGVLLATDRTTPEGGSSVQAVRGGVEAVAGPVGGVLSAPVRWAGSVGDAIGGYFFAVSENRKLKAEVAELRAWKAEAVALKNVNARYEALLGLRLDPPVPTVAARAVLESRGPFSRSKLLDVGAARGVHVGNPVVDENGLVGRVTGVTGGVSRMVLLTDVASRTPVLIERTDARAVLTGDGSNSPRLDFIRGVGALKAGDRVLSSGDGGGLPRGLPVGVVAKGMDGAWRVKLFSDRGAVDYVRVLLFQNFAQLVDPNALNAPPLAGLNTAPEPTAQQAAAIGDAAARRQAQAQAQAERARAAAAAAAATAAPNQTSSPAAGGATPAATQRPTTARPVSPRPSSAQAAPSGQIPPPQAAAPQATTPAPTTEGQR